VPPCHWQAARAARQQSYNSVCVAATGRGLTPDWLLFILVAWAVLIGLGLVVAALRFLLRLIRLSLYRAGGQASRDEERYWEIQREVSKS
jgi:hypothetical protein